MKQGSTAGWVALLVAGCAAAPAPTDYQALLMAPCAAATDDTPWLAVVQWADGETYRQVTRFEADGVMAYAREDEGLRDFDDERWAISGSTLTFDMNNHFADYTGTFDGVRARGTVKNVNGNSGTWTLTRDCAG